MRAHARPRPRYAERLSVNTRMHSRSRRADSVACSLRVRSTDMEDGEEDRGHNAANDPARKAKLRALVEELKAQRAAERAAAATPEVDETPLANQMAACGSDEAAFRELGVCVVRKSLTKAQVEKSSKVRYARALAPAPTVCARLSLCPCQR